MFERQSKIHKRFAILFAFGCLSFVFLNIIPAYATASDITITSPVLNGRYTSTSISVSGTFTSPTNPPTITVTVDQSGRSASVGVESTENGIIKGSWSSSINVGNGWHTLHATISDGNGALSDSVQFYVNDGTTIIPQIKWNQINVEYSQACQAMTSRGDYSSCPSLDKLIPVDTSNQRVSGHFVQGKYGIVREKPQLTNAYQFYDKPTVCVACFIDANSESTMKIIWIVPRGFSYTLHDYASHNENITTSATTYQISTINDRIAGLTVYHDKFVNELCNSAQVVYKDSTTLPTTIQYMKDGCKDKNYLNTTQTIVPNTPFSFDNPYSSLFYKQQVAKIVAAHPGKCFNDSCGLTTSTKKPGW